MKSQIKKIFLIPNIKGRKNRKNYSKKKSNQNNEVKEKVKRGPYKKRQKLPNK